MRDTSLREIHLAQLEVHLEQQIPVARLMQIQFLVEPYIDLPQR